MAGLLLSKRLLMCGALLSAVFLPGCASDSKTDATSLIGTSFGDACEHITYEGEAMKPYGLSRLQVAFCVPKRIIATRLKKAPHRATIRRGRHMARYDEAAQIRLTRIIMRTYRGLPAKRVVITCFNSVSDDTHKMSAAVTSDRTP